MKAKLFLEFSTIALVLSTVWFALSRIDFVSEDDLTKFSKASERKLSELILKTLEDRPSEFNQRKIKTYIDSIGYRICIANNIPFDSIKIHIIDNGEVNAFALPDRNMVIYSGLIKNARSAEEVAGVMAHEIGHMEKDHVMKKLAKEIGISMLFVLAGGSENLEVMKQAGRTLSSTAFDRSQEREADAFAVDALAKAEIDTEPFGNFLFRLSMEKDNFPEELVWISTHPDSKERAAEVFKKKDEFTFTPKPILTTSWAFVTDLVKDSD
jgi:beta-barrel assembly-enhancing protease